MNLPKRFDRHLVLLAVTLTVAACGGGESTEPTGGSTIPSVSLSVAPSSISNGATATLNWSSTNATTCTASVGWSGSKATSGSEATVALTQNTSYTLSCTGPGGTAQASTQVTVAPVVPTAPTVSLAASPSTITSGQQTTLTWSSTNATTCVATGGWTGSKATSGTQTFSPTTSTGYTLTCTGAGALTAQQTAQVTVNAVPPPTLPTVTLNATPSAIAVNATSTLSWSSTNATSCTASGSGWSGARATTGTATVGPLTVTTDYALTCTGPGGSASASTSVGVSGGGGGSSIVGAVDSVHIDLGGTNRVYIFNGTVTPQDYRGTAGDPIASVPVIQDDNACTFSFASAALAPGTYTVAFTSQAQNDNPNATNTLAFVGSAQVTVAATPATRNFAAPTILRVGPGRTYSTVAAAAAAATTGAVIEVDAGTYNNDIVDWGPNNIVVRGMGGLAHIHGTANVPNGKGLWVIGSTRMRVENFEFSGATVADENGAGIRYDGGSNLTICRSSFHDNENGILTGGQSGTLTIEYSTFANNGIGDGFTHNVYVGSGSTGNRLVFQYNYSHHARIGHTLKSRADVNYVLYNRIMDEATGSSSYTVDVPNGGLTYVIGNLLQQGPNTDNSAIVAYGQEGLQAGRTHNFYLINNTIVNDDSGGNFVISNGSTPVFYSANNFFVGPGATYSGKTPTTSTTNISSTTPSSAGLVDRAGFDYRLTSGSPAKDVGSSLGSGDGYALAPVYEYLHPAGRQLRKTTSPPIDAGAYEY